jgi:hypothetical protein
MDGGRSLTEQVRFARPDFTRWVAETMAARPGATERTLTRHRATADGLCAECSQSAAAWWPCTASAIA